MGKRRPTNGQENVNLFNTRRVLDPATYTPDMANRLAPWTAQSGLLTAATADRAYGMDADTSLLDGLSSQANEDLALGGSLNSEEIRAATQGARAAFSARGMAGTRPGILAEVMQRAQYSNARRRERQGFAAGVEGLRQKRLESSTGVLSALAGISNQGYEQAENIRQFELERDDNLRFNDKSAAVNLATGNANAAAASSAAKKQQTGAAVTAAATIAVAIF